jgi:hypothetical protein
MEVVMRVLSITLFIAATAMSTALAAPERTVDGSIAAIRQVVSGETCTGDEVLIFGESGPGSAGTFERKGRPSGAYAVGYGTIMIRRGQELHGHVTSVSVADHVLYMSTGTYRCGAPAHPGAALPPSSLPSRRGPNP